VISALPRGWTRSPATGKPFYLSHNQVLALNVRAMLAIWDKHKPCTKNCLRQILGILHRHQTIILARQYGRRHL
jgi:hypothetical protein